MPVYTSAYGKVPKPKYTGYTGGPPPVGGGQPPQSGPGTEMTDPLHGPGSIDFDLTQPEKTAQQAAESTQQLTEGLRAVLFGTTKPDVHGQHGGIMGVGNIPGVGDVLRGGTDVVLGGAGAVVGAVADAAFRLPTGLPGNDMFGQDIRSRFAAIPDTFVGKQEALKAIEEDTGLFGTGQLTKHEHLMTDAIVAWEEEQVQLGQRAPDLYSNLFRPAASFGDAIANLFGVVTVPVRTVERLVAGAGKPGDGGMNQLATIMAVADGHAAWDDGSTDLTVVEALVAAKYGSGEWTETEALDFLSAHMAGFSHNVGIELAANILLDPLLIGSLGAGAVAKLGKLGITLNQLERTTQLAVTQQRALIKTLSGAERIAAEANLIEREKAALSAINRLRPHEEYGKFNVLARATGTRPVAGTLRPAVTKFGDFYANLAGTSLGRVSKTARTIIDPLHLYGDRPRTMAAIEQGSREVTEAVAHAVGPVAYKDLVMKLATTEGLEGNVDLLERGLAIYAGNAFRRIAGRAYRAAQEGRYEALRPTLPEAHVPGIFKATSKRTLMELEEDVIANMNYVWSRGDDENLAKRLASLWGSRDERGWAREIATWNKQQKSLAHVATWGTAVDMLHAIKNTIRAEGQVGALADKLGRIILLNKGTLTKQGAYGILDRLDKAATIEAKMAELETALHTYKELRNFVKDPTSPERTLNDFVDFVKSRLNGLPSQVLDEERPHLPPALRDFDEATRDVYTIGFRPEDKYLWGLERNTSGELAVIGDPWFDQVADDMTGYTPVRQLSYNLHGQTFLDQTVGRAARLLDSAELSGKVLMHGVNGAMISAAARTKFTQTLTDRYAGAGLSQTDVEKLWDAMQDIIDAPGGVRAYASIRGLDSGTLWKAAQEALGTRVAVYSRAGLDRRALMRHVLEAYEGDARFVGMTQLATGKAKTLLFDITGQNWGGMVAEHAWPTLKFRLNPFFALQELIEPWVLNSQRGASVARTAAPGSLTQVDQLTLQLYDKMTQTNLVHMADNDISELGAKMNWGKALSALGNDPHSPFGRTIDALQRQGDVQGIKRLNMMRTWKKGVARQLKEVWEQTEPGRWDDMLAQYRANAGTVVDEDDFAVFQMWEHFASNDIKLTPILDESGKRLGWETDFGSIFKVGTWAEPQDFGDLRPLDLKHLISQLDITDINGKPLGDIPAVKQALADKTLDWEEVAMQLRMMNAHPDYVMRVGSAFHFSYERFWDDVATTFSLDDPTREMLESFYARIAARRKMTPVEYLSQVYQPNVVGEGKGGVGSLGAIVDEVKRLQDLAALEGKVGVSTPEDLYRQMAHIMATHLDPSAKRSFLMAYDQELRNHVLSGRVALDIGAVDDMWQSGASDALADRIIGYIRGQPGTGARVDVAADAPTGVKSIRDKANEVMAANGRPRSVHRYISEDAADDLLRELADSYDAQLAASIVAHPNARLTHIPTTAELDEVVTIENVNLVRHESRLNWRRNPGRPEFGVMPVSHVALEAVEPIVRESYIARARETRRLYNIIVDDMKFRVTPVKSATPYANADALRADLDKGRIKVPRSGYWHPAYDSSDLFMERVVSDVFGYGQEANEFGSHDAIARVAALYKDDARSVLLPEKMSRRAWETHSSRVLPNDGPRPTTADEFEARHGGATSRPETPSLEFGDVAVAQTRRLGVEFREMEPEHQAELLPELSSLLDNFPDVGLETVNATYLGPGVGAVTLDYELEVPGIVMGKGSGVGGTVEEGIERRISRMSRSDSMATDPESPFHPGLPRRTPIGVRPAVSDTPVGDLYHEFAHVVDAWLHRLAAQQLGRTPRAGEYVHPRMSEFWGRFMGSDALLYLSEYASEPSLHPIMRDSEAFAELFDLAFNPEHAQDLVYGGLWPDDVVDFAREFRQVLEEVGAYKPGHVTPVRGLGGKTVAEANAAGANIVPEHIFAPMPQELMDKVHDTFIGTGRYGESNPDIARVSGYFNQFVSDWVETVVEKGGNVDPGYLHVLDEASGMPVDVPAAYNYTEAALRHAVAQQMAAKWEDAFRLQYFAQSRSMLQRSINHPMFGLYPASYMWGKVGPELVRFIAAEPFGMNTGAMLYTLKDLQMSVAAQRNFDPEFDAFVEKLGHSAALDFLGYMLPATPWSVPASAPAWMRNLAQQGYDNEQAAETGGAISDIDYTVPLRKAVEVTFPVPTRISWASRAAAEIGEALPWYQAESTGGGGGYDALGRPLPGGVVAPVDLSEPTRATDLGGILEEQIRVLEDTLG